MNPDINFLVEMWDSVKTYIPKKDRIQAAEHLVTVCDEHLDISESADYLDMFDSIMKSAIKGHFSFDEEDDEDWE